MALLLDSAAMRSDFTPESKGGNENAPDNAFSASYTANWKMRADYVLPSTAGLEIVQGEAYLPGSNESLHRLTGHANVVSSGYLVV